MKKFVTYAVMLAYLTVTIRPIQAQSQQYNSGGTPVQRHQPAPTDVYQQSTPITEQSLSGEIPKVAVYVSERRGYSSAEEAALRTATLNTLVRSGQYDVIERSNIIDAELNKQASGAIDDDQLTAFGRQAGAQYVCIADMTFISNQRRYDSKYYQISVRMIDVETAEVLAFGLVERHISGGDGLTFAVVSAVNKLLATAQPAKAANMPKMAVYVTGTRAKQKEGDVLYSYMLEALFTRSRNLGTFKVIERSDAFTKQLDREQTTQRSGHVDDNQIARLGKQYGIERILVASIDYAMNNYIISSRIINVETANVENASNVKRVDSDLNYLGELSIKMVEEMMGLTNAEITNRTLEANAEAEVKRKEAISTAEAKRKEEITTWTIVGVIIVGILGLVIWAIANPKEDTATGSGRR